MWCYLSLFLLNMTKIERNVKRTDEKKEKLYYCDILKLYQENSDLEDKK